MDRSVKAALLSGLVFPGVGQMFLGLWLRGLLFLLPAGAAAGYFVTRVWTLAMAINADIASGRMPFDPLIVAQRVHEQSATSTGAMNWAALVMIVCWLASTADAWFAGKRRGPG